MSAGNATSGGVAPAKKLGQHFLHNPRVIDRIVQSINPQPGQIIAEIGPGTGALTKPLLEAGAHVVAVEMDDRCWPILEAMPNLTLVRGDALNLSSWLPLIPNNSKIVGNLPYNVGTEIVATLLTAASQIEHSNIRTSPFVFMLQKEVILRICAQPGGGEWGRLGVLTQLHSNARKLFDVPPGAFNPPPKVMSSMVEITPLPAPRFNVNPAQLDKLLRLSFGQRRKMLRASLKGHLSEEQITALGIKPTARPEELPLEHLCKLANAL